MSVQELETAVRQLPTPELAQFAAWFEEYQADLWDKQIEQDVTACLLFASKSLENTALMTSSYLEQRATRGERTRFEQALGKVSSAPAEERDRL